MDDAGSVGGGDAVGDLYGQVEQLARPVDRRQRTSLEEFHDEVVRPDVVQLTDVRVIERRDRAGFAFEAVAEFGGRLLDGDEPVQPRVARLVDLAHSAGADRFEDVVRAEPRARLQGHRGGILPCDPHRPDLTRRRVESGDAGRGLAESAVAERAIWL